MARYESPSASQPQTLEIRQQRRQIPRPDARELGIDMENRWLPARFFGFNLDPEVWHRDVTDELPPLDYTSDDFRSGIDWERTLANWESKGLAFDWNRDSKRSKTGFISRHGLESAEGRLMELRQHKPEVPQD